jgi:hypothetical protein
VIPAIPIVVAIAAGAWWYTRRPSVDKLVKIAKSYVGVNEDPPGSNSGPVVDLFRPRGTPPGAWCAYFVSFVVREAGVGTKSIASVQAIADAAEAAGVWSEVPSVGAVLIMLKTDQDLDGVDKGLNHTGIVVGIAEDGRVVTVEGNYSNGVRLVTRRRSEISGYVPFASLGSVFA